MLLSPRKSCYVKNVVMVPSAPRTRDMRDRLKNKLGKKVYLFFILGRSGRDGDELIEK